jgi:hypothetical protein
VPATLVAFAGALQLVGELEPTPFLVKPGPAVPYVIPRLLEHPDVTAVVTGVAVGRHQGYVISYFAAPGTPIGDRANDWGASFYRVARDGAARDGWNTYPEDGDEYDFNLEPWLESERLLWIAPEDDSITLRAGVAECPYVALDGRREIQRLQGATVW